MARRLFFVPEVHSGFAELRGDDAKHLTRVLRVERGEVYQISDNRALYLAEVDAAHKELVSFRVVDKVAVPEPKAEIILCAALIKFDHFEWMIEKATELGVDRWVPLQTERGVVDPGVTRLNKLRQTVVAACKQCGRNRLLEISSPVTWPELLAESGAARGLLVADPAGED